jgi:hypothetical protein
MVSGLHLLALQSGAPLGNAAGSASSLATATDWQALGLACAILGCFLVANAILFRHPRRLVHDFFGTQKPRLHSIREYIFNRSQTHLGFFYLMAGFGLMLFGRLRPPGPDEVPTLPMVWVGVLVLSTAALEGLSWWYSRRLFRAYVRTELMGAQHDFGGDMRTAVEVGELFDVEQRPEDTVQTYIQRLRQAVGVPPQTKPFQEPRKARSER